jgi:signal peptidase I
MLQFITPEDLKEKHLLRRVTLVAVILVVIAALVTGYYLFLHKSTQTQFSVTLDGNAMQPAFPKGTRLLLEKRDTYRTGDIVSFHDPADNMQRVRRIIATAGQTVYLNNGKVIVNGLELTESYPVVPAEKDTTPLTVPGGMVYVLGDNRNNSRDSRDFGPVPLANITGTVK